MTSTSTLELGSAKQAAGPAGEEEPLLVFRSGNLSLAVPVHCVDQIHATPGTTPIPLAPPHVAGLAVLRGEVVPLVSLERFLELETGLGPEDQPQGGGQHRRVAVISSEGMQVGLMCSEVKGIVPVRLGGRREVRVARGRRLERVVAAEVSTGDEVLLVLDVAKLLEETRVKL